MRGKSYLYLLGAVIIASGVVYFERPGEQRGGTAEHPLIAGMARDTVARLEIEHLLNAVTLVRDGTAWQVQSLPSAMGAKLEAGKTDAVTAVTPPQPGPHFPADGARVQQVIDVLSGLSVGAVASRNPEKQNQLQLSALGLQVRAFDTAGKKIAHLFVGKQGPDYFTTYVRRDGEDEAYLVHEPLSGRFPVRVTDWRDKAVWNIDADAIAEVEISRLDGGFTLVRDAEDAFMVKESQEAKLDAQRLTGWLSRWTALKAQAFPEGIEEKATGLAKPAVTLRVAMKDGSERILQLGQESPQGGPYARRIDREDLYVLPTTLQSALEVDWAEWVVDEKTETTETTEVSAQ
jgi:hypothetical protein